MTYTWDQIDRFKNDPCGCKLCQRLQEVVRNRNPGVKLSGWYRLLEDMDGQKAQVEIRIA